MLNIQRLILIYLGIILLLTRRKWNIYKIKYISLDLKRNAKKNLYLDYFQVVSEGLHAVPKLITAGNKQQQVHIFHHNYIYVKLLVLPLLK